MSKSSIVIGISAALAAACLVLGMPLVADAATAPDDGLKRTVDAAVAPLMTKDAIPGLVVGITAGGRHTVFNYGVAAIDTSQPVGDSTLFEIGSLSKTFTATLACWAEVEGHLSLADETAAFLPRLRGTSFGRVSLLNLGTHTPGGLPLQVPDTIADEDQLLAWLRTWKPTYPPGTYRTYANPSIGLLGVIAAQSLHQNFTALAQDRLFPALGLSSTYLEVPPAKRADYAQGYTRTGEPIRLKPGVLWAEAYGVKTTAHDLLRFLDANMGLVTLSSDLQRAVMATHTGYFKAGVLTQDLIWEQYAYPVDLQTLLNGNAPQMVFNATPAAPIIPPLPPQADVLINKTGSTNGFAAYAAFIPARRSGIVILANKSFSTEHRVRLAYRILAMLEVDATHQRLDRL
jgi:beta-lactamase class C